MKGLLLKDFYMAKRYCRSFFVIVLLFIAISVIGENNTFFVFYPVLMGTIVPVTLLAYDERSKWETNSATMPYTRAQLVSAKYIDMLFLLICCLILVGISQYIRMAHAGEIQWKELGRLMGLLSVVGTVSPCLMLPVIFRFGAEKGRVMYFVVIIAFFVAIATFSNILPKDYQLPSGLQHWIVLAGIIVIGLTLLISWRISIYFYEKREL